MAFEYRHALLVPVTTCGIETSFLLDTGAGLSLISDHLAAQVGCTPDGSMYTGHRMSGQPLTIPLGQVGSLELGTHSTHDVTVGILDFPALAGLEGLGGMLSLSYFRSVPVTIDYQAGLVVIEDQASLGRRLDAGTAVSVRLDHDGASTGLMLGVDLPGGRAITVEVDTGSDTLVLNESLAAEAGVDLRSESTTRFESTDETGHEFDPDVMFQKIIYDGLVGDRFLRKFTTTYDLANSRMIFAVP